MYGSLRIKSQSSEEDPRRYESFVETNTKDFGEIEGVFSCSLLTAISVSSVVSGKDN
jgi:hypothetical protein